MSVEWEYSSMIITAPFNQYEMRQLFTAGKEGWEVIHVNQGGVALMRRKVKSGEKNVFAECQAFDGGETSEV